MQDQNHTPAEFIRRTDALKKRLGISLVETGARIGISKAMLFAYRSGKSPISDKTWRRLSEAEKKAGVGAEYPNAGDSSLRVEEPKAQTEAFREYTSAVRSLREEAATLANGDPQKTEEWFEKLLATWRDTVAARRRGGSREPFVVGEKKPGDLARAVTHFEAGEKKSAPPGAAGERKHA